MHPFFLLFVLLALLILVSGAQAIRKGEVATGIVSILAAIACVAVGHYLFNF